MQSESETTLTMGSVSGVMLVQQTLNQYRLLVNNLRLTSMLIVLQVSLADRLLVNSF